MDKIILMVCKLIVLLPYCTILYWCYYHSQSSQTDSTAIVTLTLMKVSSTVLRRSSSVATLAHTCSCISGYICSNMITSVWTCQPLDKHKPLPLISLGRPRGQISSPPSPALLGWSQYEWHSWTSLWPRVRGTLDSAAWRLWSNAGNPPLLLTWTGGGGRGGGGERTDQCQALYIHMYIVLVTYAAYYQPR